MIKEDSVCEEEGMTLLFERYGAVWLLSPAYTPEYNGATEASMRWMKVHALIRPSSEEAWRCGAVRTAKPLGVCPTRPPDLGGIPAICPMGLGGLHSYQPRVPSALPLNSQRTRTSSHWE